MKHIHTAFTRKLCTLLTALLYILTLSGSALAEFVPAPTMIIVSFDHIAMDGWLPSYGLNAPGVLLELSHAEAMLSVNAVEKGEMTVAAALEERLDHAGETLSVENAQMGGWHDSLDGDGQMLTFSYTYPDGDERHEMLICAASHGNLLIELSIDCWGEEAELLMENARAAFVENSFSLIECRQPLEMTASLRDIIEDKNGTAHICLSFPDENGKYDEHYYPLSEYAAVLFPNPDDPSMLYPVSPDMISLIDAVLTYEENSDGPAVFYSIIENDRIVYMEYSLLIP